MNKLPIFGKTIFSVMSQMAFENNAINLSQGFPDYDPDARLTALLSEAALSDQHQYAPMAGHHILREKISLSLLEKYNVQVCPVDEITITAGATQAIFTVLASLVGAGDEVLMFDPAYDSYAPSVMAQGGIPVRIPLIGPEFQLDWDRVDQAVTSNTRVVIINNPNNPAGTVFTEYDLKQLADLAERHDLVVLSDEVYSGIVYDKRKHYSVLSVPSLKDRSFVVYSFGKSFHITGWKIGYCVAPPRYTELFRNLHQFLVFSVNSPAQYALANYMSLSRPEEDLNCFFQVRRDLICAGLHKVGFKIVPAQGTYFQIADYSLIQPKMDEMAFARWLTENYGVACIPLMPFYKERLNQRLVRFCFAKKIQTLDAAINNLMRI